MTGFECPMCGYEIATHGETVEAVENGNHCLLCGGDLDGAQLEEKLAAWDDDAVIAEGKARAVDESELAEEEAWLDAGPDFGDEGEDDEDELV